MKSNFFKIPVLALAVVSAISALSVEQDEVHGIRIHNMDTSVAPGDNFFRYANGAFLSKTEIPADRTSMSGFSLLTDTVNKRVAAIVEEIRGTQSASNPDSRKVADLYASYMDTGKIDANGMTALKPRLAALAAIHTRRDLAAALGETLRADVDALNNTNFHTANLFGIWVAPGFRDPDHYTAYFMQGGLQLPDRAYYLTDSPRMKEIRNAYLKHIAAMLTLTGLDNVEARAAGILALETAIAQRHLTLAENEDIRKANNVWAASDFAKNAPGLDWSTYFAAADLAKQSEFIVWQPSAVTAEASLVAETPVDTWKDYLVFHMIEQYSAGTSTAAADERFNFAGKVLTGAQQQRPREQRAVLLVSSTLGDAVGRAYAERYFTLTDKAKVEAMVKNLLIAFRARLQKLTWMSADTRAEALRKLDTLQIGIGYSGKWRSYDGLVIKSDDLFGNLWRASLFDYHYAISRIGKPTDRKEWVMTPQTVNAVNLPLDNGLNFPAAIFGPPFFDPRATDAVNYGAIGTIIGHEISHTFDSEGATFDSRGQVRNWWTDADRAHFDASIEALAKQYDTYAPFPDLHLNGHQTLGENIADLAGLTASHDAWVASLNGQPAPVVGGLTGEQQFFLGFAQSEVGKAREPALRQQVLTDPHSPGEYRADTVRNLDAWYAAFDVKPGQALYLPPSDRVHIW